MASPSKSQPQARRRSSGLSQFIRNSTPFSKNRQQNTEESSSRDDGLPARARLLQNEVSAVWPDRHQSRYKSARALLVCWGDNDPYSEEPEASEEYYYDGNEDNDDMRPTSRPSEDVLAPEEFSYLTSRHLSPKKKGSISENPTTTTTTTEGSSSHRSHRPEHTNINTGNGTTNNGKGGRGGGANAPFIDAAYQLATVFTRRYGIAAQVWIVPTLESPQDALAAKVTQFVHDFGGRDNLLIFWYGGRAEFVAPVRYSGVSGGEGWGAGGDGPGWGGGGGGGGGGGIGTTGELVWFGSRSNPGIQARSISRILGTARADVLMLNDCPHAQHAYHANAHGPNIFEILGAGTQYFATGHNNNDYDVGNPYSYTPSYPQPHQSQIRHDYRRREAAFTRTLLLMLDSPFLAARGVSVVDLHRKLVDMVCPKLPGQTVPGRVFTTSCDGPSSPPPSLSAASAIRGSSGLANAHAHPHARDNETPMRARRVISPPAYPVYCQTSSSSSSLSASGVVQSQMERDAAHQRSIVITIMDPALVASGPNVGAGGRPTSGDYLNNRGNGNGNGNGNGSKGEKGGDGKMATKKERLRLDLTLKRTSRAFLDIKRWREWVLSAPGDVEDVSVSTS